MPSFIPDGYEVDGYIAPSTTDKAGQRLHDGMTFRYRMASRPELAVQDNKVSIALRNDHNDPNCSLEAERLSAEFVASHLRSWDLKDGESAVPITKENVSRVQVNLFDRLYRIVRGMELSDKRPDGTDHAPLPKDATGN